MSPLVKRPAAREFPTQTAPGAAPQTSLAPVRDQLLRIRRLEASRAAGGDGTWAELNLLNGWQAAGSPYATTIEYRSDKVIAGEADFRGVLDTANAVSGSIVGIIPVANRPATKLLFQVAIASASGDIGLGVATVSELTGALVVFFAAPALAPFMPGVQVFTPFQIKFAHTSNDVEVVQDGTVVGSGYASITATWSPAEDDPENGGPAYPAYMNFPIWLGKPDGNIGRPRRGGPGSPVADTAVGGYWGHFIAREGPDAPTYALRAANAIVDGYVAAPWSAALNWVDIVTGDLYAASDAWVEEAWYMEIQGSTGDQFTSYGGPTDGEMDGPPGLYYFCFIRTGKNASSSGYVLDVSELGVSGIAY